MPLRTDMPTRQDARPGAGDQQHATDYDPARAGWYPADETPAPPAAGERG